MGWEELKKSFKECYFPLNHTIVKMNKFLSCIKRGWPITNYYEESVKLSRHAPLMKEIHKLRQFILGLEGQIAEETNALWPLYLVDALIRAKAKLHNFQVRDQKRKNPFVPLGPFCSQKANLLARPSSNQVSLPLALPKLLIWPIKVNFLPINQSGQKI